MSETGETPEDTPTTTTTTQSSTDSTDQCRRYVLAAIRKWKKGDLFMDYGISESETIISKSDEIPTKDDKEHPFNKFMAVVAKDILADKEEEISNDKKIAKKES